MSAASLPPGRLKTVPEDFVVEEIPLYEPSGEGDHLYIRFTKRDLTTDAAVRAIAEALFAPSAPPMREIGIAGMKDKRAVTTQTISVPAARRKDGPDPEAFVARARGLELPGITIVDARRHGNKLKTGHLEANRFDIVVRGVPRARVGEVIAKLDEVGRVGVPNAFGVQRFGRDHDNAERALAWLTGKAPAPRDPRQRRFMWSALQSALFNDVLARRVEDGTWAIPLEGDLLKKADSGGIFPCTDAALDGERARRGEVSPTGPMFGVKMRSPEGVPGQIERDVFDARLGRDFDLGRTKSLGEGARRPLRVPVTAMEVAEVDASGQDASIRARFVLPRGTYATTVLAAAVMDESFDRGGSRFPGEAQHERRESDAEPDEDALGE